jgi:hypothetical protein
LSLSEKYPKSTIIRSGEKPADLVTLLSARPVLTYKGKRLPYKSNHFPSTIASHICHLFCFNWFLGIGAITQNSLKKRTSDLFSLPVWVQTNTPTLFNNKTYKQLDIKGINLLVGYIVSVDNKDIYVCVNIYVNMYICVRVCGWVWMLSVKVSRYF